MVPEQFPNDARSLKRKVGRDGVSLYHVGVIRPILPSLGGELVEQKHAS